MSVKHGRGNVAKRDLPLQITSMLDMFTLILLFLLKSFSVEGSILANADNLVLPNSSSKRKPKSVNLQLAVTSEMVLIDNVAVMPTDDIRKLPPDAPDPVIHLIADKLSACRAQEEELVKSGALHARTEKIVIQVDKNIGFDVLFKIMNTCAKAEYTAMDFAVMEREG
jgi:biopolymer transport protein ExbD